MGPKRDQQIRLSLYEKLEILQRLDRGESNEDIIRIYNITRRSINGIIKNRQKIIDYSTSQSQMENLNSKHMKSTSASSLELHMYKWFMDKRNAGIIVTGPELREEAMRINRELGGTSKFKASSGWLHRFKHRHGIKQHNLPGTGLSPVDIKSAQTFCDELQKLIEENGYKHENIYNVVRNGLQYQSRMYHDIENPGALRILKDRVPLVLGVNADGSHRLKVLVSGRVQNPRSFKNEQVPVKYVFHGNGYPRDLLIAQWFSEVFTPEIKERRKESESQEKILLVMDTAPTSSMMNQVKEFGVNFVCIPPEAIPFIQPLYQGIFERFKNMYLEAFMNEMVVVQDGKKYALDKKWTIRDSCYAIANAWDSFTSEDFQMAWGKLLKIVELDDRDNQVAFHSCGITEEQEEQMELGESSCSSSDVTSLAGSTQSNIDFRESFEGGVEFKNVVPFGSIPQDVDPGPAKEQLDTEETNLREEMKQIPTDPSTSDALKAVTTIFKWANFQENTTRKDIWDIVKMRLMVLNK